MVRFSRKILLPDSALNIRSARFREVALSLEFQRFKPPRAEDFTACDSLEPILKPAAE